jgi:hypothetical protein
MAVTDEKDGALATAAVAAAAGAAVYGLKKALESSNGSKTLSRRDRDDDSDDDRDEGEGGGSLSRASGLLDTVWDSASDALVPLAEDAADAAGKWVAQNSPDLIRERIIPRFIESFTDAA